MASIIDPTLAKSLIKEFRQHNSSAGGPALKTPEGHFLNGFFIDRESLENILKDPKNVGIHIHLAKHPDFAGKPDNVHTIAFVGSQPNTAPGAATPYVSSGDIYEYSVPCPPYCTDL
jgi:hypothetical protein